MIREIDKFNAQDLIAARAQALGEGAGKAGAADKKKAAEEFVSLLFLEVLKAMRAGIPKGGLFESDSVENDIYTSLADTEVARAIAGKEALGLRSIIEKALDQSSGKGVDASVIKSSDSGPGRALQQKAANVAKLVDAIVPEEIHNHELGLPASGAVSSKFGLRADPWTGESRLHKGLDIAAPAGSPVKAVAAGKVVFSGWAAGYGNLVTIDHGDGTSTRYGHNQVNLVHSGDEIAPGQEIALVGATGRVTGPHLHFEIRRNGEAVDPMQVAGFQRVFNKTRKG
jgi:murein DD-endopeptidase MepM/ murein hydrolase activator NlpD